MRSIAILAVCLAAALPAVAAAATPEQFDLDCRGAYQPAGEPFSIHLRIDLLERVFCEYSCEEALPLTRVNRRRIEHFEQGGDERDHLVIWRANWRYTRNLVVLVTEPANYLMHVSETAHCEIRPFSGIKPSYPPLVRNTWRLPAFSDSDKRKK